MSQSEYWLVVVGKAGCGKSTVCNKLLTGRADGPFRVYSGMDGQTEQFKCETRTWLDGTRVHVVDSPDVFSMGYSPDGAQRKFQEWKHPAVPTDKAVFVFVVQMHERFTPNDVEIYHKYNDLLPHKHNTILAFTYTEGLQNPLLDEIELSPVKNLYEKMGRRYVAFSKTDSGQQCNDNLKKVLKMADEIRAHNPATIPSSSSTDYRFVVVGKRGCGKSTVCNKLLTGRADRPFPVNSGTDGWTEHFLSGMKTCQDGTRVHIVDSPDVFSSGQANPSAKFQEWELVCCTPDTPTAFLFTVRLDKVVEDEKELYQKYFSWLSPDHKKCVMLAFTHAKEGQNALSQKKLFADVLGIPEENLICLKFDTEDDAQQSLVQIVSFLSDVSKTKSLLNAVSIRITNWCTAWWPKTSSSVDK